jgi:hypothetical protein
MYRFWHWLHVSAYTPLLEYPSGCCWWCVGASIRSMWWAVLSASPKLVHLKRFVTAWTSSPTNVNLAHLLGFFVSRSQLWLLVVLLAVEVLYRLARRMRWITSSSCSLFSGVVMYVLFLRFRNLIAFCLCSFGWHESAGIIEPVAVGFRYMLKCILSLSHMMVISRKFNLLLFSSSKVKRSVGTTHHRLPPGPHQTQLPKQYVSTTPMPLTSQHQPATRDDNRILRHNRHTPL